jgi:hypothetical protein
MGSCSNWWQGHGSKIQLVQNTIKNTFINLTANIKNKEGTLEVPKNFFLHKKFSTLISIL